MLKRLAVLGHPVAHSRSPAMQAAALAELGLENWTYEAIDVAPADLEARVRAMPGEGFVGANVTVPHKGAALALADSASTTAREIGAANTLSFGADGVAAENTDASGFLDALPRAPAGLRALVLGAGGSARAVVWALVTGGAEVSVWNRTPEKAEALANEFGAAAVRSKPGGRTANDEARACDLLVNCTTVGMGTGGPALKELPLAVDSISERQIVVDLAYGPAETELARAWRERGASVVDGIEVLVHQGAASLRIWTGKEPPLETMRRAALIDDGNGEPPRTPESRTRPGRGAAA